MVVLPFRDISWWFYLAGISRGGFTLQGYLVVVLPGRDISWWFYPAGISRGGFTLQGYLVVVFFTLQGQLELRIQAFFL